ncbi:MAG: hypothetical protein AAGG44_17620 [Planctomycetota bacterium]
MTYFRVDQGGGLNFYVVAYEKAGEAVWCDSPMSEKQTLEMLATLKKAGVAAKAFELSLSSGRFEDLARDCNFLMKPAFGGALPAVPKSLEDSDSFVS